MPCQQAQARLDSQNKSSIPRVLCGCCDKPVAVFRNGRWVAHSPHGGEPHANAFSVTLLVEMLLVSIKNNAEQQNALDKLHILFITS